MTPFSLRTMPAAALALALSACVTTETQPDGSTRVRVSAAQALGMKPAAAAPRASIPQAAASTPSVVAAPPKAIAAVPSKQVKSTPARLKAVQRGLECDPGKYYGDAINALGLPDDRTVVDAPAGLKVFGLPVAKVAFYLDADYDEPYTRTIFAAGVTFAQVKKAAGLKAEKHSGQDGTPKVYAKYTKFGGLYAAPNGPFAPAIEIACSIPVH